VGKRYFGNVRKRASGRYQARYTGPDGRTWSAPFTFDSRQYATAWLSRVHGDIQAGRWVPPSQTRLSQTDLPPTLAAYAAAWTESRELSPTSRLTYSYCLRHILPALGATPLPGLTPAMVREWHAKLKDSTGPTMRAKAYGVLRAICNTAIADDIIGANPCRVRGAGQAKRARRIEGATLAELEAIVTAMPPRLRLMVLLAAWCALRFGELAELRRADIDVKNSLVHVRRGVVRGDTGTVVKDPKSEAGKRAVAIPPHLMPAVHDHLIQHTGRGRDALLFPAARGGHLRPDALYKEYYPAREAAGRPDLRFHDLRHTGATLAAVSGATLKELMARLGHSTVDAALRYQHAAADRDKVIAAALSDLAAGTVTPISKAKGGRKRA
jgi:integrase